MWRNKQTRYVQGVVGVTPWEFESPPRHRAANLSRRAGPRTFTCEDTHRRELRMAADPLGGLEESPSCTEQGCPVKAGETRQRVDSPHWRVPGCENNRDQSRRLRSGGLKRVILPAAISDSTVCRLLAKVGSREPSRRRRRDQPSWLREMAISNRTRLTPSLLRENVWCP